jgi:hypothetical protein
MSKITYTDKVDNTVSQLPDINKVKAADLNEIKTSVNAIYDDKGGFANYEDVATITTPIVLSANTWTNITNDKQGEHTTEVYKPAYVTGSLWNSATSKIDLSEVAVGKVVLIKVDFEIVQTSNNTILQGQLIGGGHTMQLLTTEMKFASGTHHYSITNMVYVEDAAMQTAGLNIQLKTSSNSQVEMHNIMITII